MLTIRLFRVGKKNQPAYKIVVCDKRNAASRGRFVEEVGFYNPLTKQRNLKGERAKYWISVGAKPSSTVHNMLVTEKVLESPKIPKNKKSKKEVPAESASSAEAGQPVADVSTEASAKVGAPEETPAAESEAKTEEPK
jgi:small subunit ribosomal protein S16